MRVSPAIRVKGRIAREVLEVRGSLATAVRRVLATAGRQHACTFDTLIYPGVELVDLRKPVPEKWVGDTDVQDINFKTATARP
jgi:hypothetical protein